jgi:hypothetical protein
MWVEAIFSKDDLAAVVADLCPLTIALGQGPGTEQYLRLLNPKNVLLVENRGLQLTCEAELLWPVLGIDVPIRVESLTLMLDLELSPVIGEEVIVLKPELEDIDVSWVPHLFDRKVKERINHELGRQQAALSWRFFQTLSHFFVLPELLNPVGGLDVQVAWGKLRVSEEAIVLAVSFHTKVARAGDTHSLNSLRQVEVAASIPRENGSPLARSAGKSATVSVPLPIAIVGGAALLGVTAYLAVGVTSRVLRFAVVRALG